MESEDEIEEVAEEKPLKRNHAYSREAKKAMALQKQIEADQKKEKLPRTPTPKFHTIDIMEASLRKWIDNFVTDTTNVTQQAVRTGSFVDRSGNSVNNSLLPLGQKLLNYNRSLMKEGLAHLENSCIGESLQCQIQLSNMYNNKGKKFVTPVVDDSIDAFFQLYEILCRVQPWVNRSIPPEEQEKIKLRLTAIRDDIDAARQLYIEDSKEDSGVSEPGRNSSMLLTLNYQLLELSVVIKSCDIPETEEKKKGFWRM